jgi:hypothetical protein
MGLNADTRNQSSRRTDRWSAERIDLAALTARAFDLHLARNYLRLSGLEPRLVDSFSTRYPAQLRAPAATGDGDRRAGDSPLAMRHAAGT